MSFRSDSDKTLGYTVHAVHECCVAAMQLALHGRVAGFSFVGPIICLVSLYIPVIIVVLCGAMRGWSGGCCG